MSTIQERHITIQESPVHIMQANPTGKKDTILLHGMKFNAQTWNELTTIQSLAEAGYHVIAIDLPSFGESPASQASPSDVIIDVIKQLKLDKTRCF